MSKDTLTTVDNCAKALIAPQPGDPYPGICPDCKGKGVIQLFSSQVPCTCRADPKRFGPSPLADFVNSVPSHFSQAMNSLIENAVKDARQATTKDVLSPAEFAALHAAPPVNIEHDQFCGVTNRHRFIWQSAGFSGCFIHDIGMSSKEIARTLRAMADQFDAQSQSDPTRL